MELKSKDKPWILKKPLIIARVVMYFCTMHSEEFPSIKLKCQTTLNNFGRNNITLAKSVSHSKDILRTN